MHSDGSFLTELFVALDAVELEAIVVGATGAALQGAPLTTLDVDLLIRDTRRNREKLRLLASRLGAAPPVRINDVAAAERISGGRVPVDILFDAMSGGLGFAGVRSRAIRIDVGGRTGLVAALADIIASKEAAGRPKDLAHLVILRETLRVRKALGGLPDAGGDLRSRGGPS